MFPQDVVFYLSLSFKGHFPGGPGLAGTRMSQFWILLERRMIKVVVTTGAPVKSSSTNKPTPNFLQDGCPSCCPTNSVKALKEKDVVFYIKSY